MHRNAIDGRPSAGLSTVTLGLAAAVVAGVAVEAWGTRIGTWLSRVVALRYREA